MTTLNDLYDYGLKIYQDTDFFKFSIDSILLAEFVNFHSHDRILDICTGNVPIPMILSQKDESLSIDGVEIQKEIYDLATKSIQINNLEDRIHILNEDIKEAPITEKYDIVTCNPPYFKVSGTSLKNENKIKQIARHEVHLTLEETVQLAAKFLKEQGKFYMVHRTERFLDTVKLLEKNKLGIRRIVFVYTKKDKKAEFFLIEASKCKKTDPKIYSIYTEGLKTYQNMFEEMKR